jgi:hypothetical protein
MSRFEYQVQTQAAVPDNDNDGKPRLTIRQIREAAQKEIMKEALVDSNSVRTSSSIGTVPIPKKKSSIFGSLFQVREPTQIALNQVAAQMIAQHGSTSATKVPNVRLERMPEHVPKVNTKWDGIPDSVKQRDNRERDRINRAKRESFFSGTSSLWPRSDDTSFARTGSRNSSATTASSFGGIDNSSGSQGASPRIRFYAQSVNSSGDLASQQRAEKPQTPTYERALSYIGSSIAETSITDHAYSGPGSNYPLEIVADKYRPATSTSELSATDADLGNSIQHWQLYERSQPTALATVQEQIHSARQQDSQFSSLLGNATDAFLAGEARELAVSDDELSRCTSTGTTGAAASLTQKDLATRPDSSRDRLGLRANVHRGREVTPWEEKPFENAFPTDAQPSQEATSTKSRFQKMLGRTVR